MFYQLTNYFTSSKILFCRDGKARIPLNPKIAGFKSVYSLEDVQNNLLSDEIEKAHFFYGFIDEDVSFEKGLTFGEFIECLKPWEKQIGVLLNTDVKSFFDKMGDSKKDQKLNSHDYKMQVARVGILSRNEQYQKKKKEVKTENGYYQYVPEEGDYKTTDGSYDLHENHVSWNVVAKDPKVDQEWYGFSNFHYLKDLELDWVKDGFLLAMKDEGICSSHEVKDCLLIKNERRANDNQVIKIRDFNDVTLFDMLKGLFFGLAQSDFGAEMLAVEIRSSLPDCEPVSLTQEQKERLINEAEKEKDFIENMKKKVETLEKKSINSCNIEDESNQILTVFGATYDLNFPIKKVE